jgi:capsular exopolysaccharide synthesis family protein
MAIENKQFEERRAIVESLDLLDYWLLIKKSQKQIWMLAFIITLLTTLVVFEMTPVYRSTSQLFIETSNKAKVLTLSDLYNEAQRGSSEAFNSQIQIIKSRPVALNVIKTLDLVNNPAIDPRQNSKWYDFKLNIFEPESKSKEEAEAKLLESVLTKFGKDLTIEPVLKSEIVKISFDSTDKVLAAKVANAVVEAYIDIDLDSRSQMTQRANMWLTDRMAGLKKNLEASEQALQQFREKENIIDNKGVVLSGTGKQYEEVSSNLVTARMRLSEAESAYNQVKNHKDQSLENLESIPAVLKDLTVQEMKRRDSEATRTVTELKDRYAAAHPKMIAALAEQKSAHEALARAVEAVINGVTREYEIARANANAAALAQNKTKDEIQSLTRKEAQLSSLQHEVDSNKALYDTFLNRAKETEVSSNLQSTAGRLVDPAEPNRIPLRPKKLQVISIAAVLGVLAGVALVILLDFLDSTMHSVPDVERRLRVNVLGTVQVLEQKEGEKILPARAFLQSPNSVFSESVRTVRTAILLSAVDKPHRVIAVTSTVPGEGKTTIAINLAFALGQLKRVLIVDSDIRRPTIGTAIGEGMDQGPGLVDYLAGEAPINECIRKTTNPNVFVLPAGKRFNSPLELISSQKFGETIEGLKDKFDLVVIDCPPLKPVSDSLIISRYADAVIFIVKADASPYQLVSAAIKRMTRFGAPLLGVVLNQVDYKKADRYGHYEYKYENNYDYSYKEHDKASKPRKSFLGIKI